MEGLNKLKELEYINLAVNNVSKIEGIRHCESLMKIDLTLNFLDVEDLEESVDNLMECEELQELYLTGNPCTSWEGYKEYVIGRVSQLKKLDGEDITKSQRLEARQKVKVLTDKLRIAAAENIQKKQQMDPKELEGAYTKESRVQQYQEMVA
jgi:protein TilB